VNKLDCGWKPELCIISEVHNVQSHSGTKSLCSYQSIAKWRTSPNNQ